MATVRDFLIKEVVKKHATATMDANYITFNLPGRVVALPRKLETGMLAKVGEQNYLLDAIWFFYSRQPPAESNFNAYKTEALEANVAALAYVDMRDVRNHLNGLESPLKISPKAVLIEPIDITAPISIRQAQEQRLKEILKQQANSSDVVENSNTAGTKLMGAAATSSAKPATVAAADVASISTYNKSSSGSSNNHAYNASGLKSAIVPEMRTTMTEMVAEITAEVIASSLKRKLDDVVESIDVDDPHLASDAPLRTSKTVVLSTTKKFDRCLDIYEMYKAAEQHQHQPPSAAAAAASATAAKSAAAPAKPAATSSAAGAAAGGPQGSAVNRKDYRIVLPPIIIVPSGVGSLLSIWNAKAFLERSVFQTFDEAFAEHGGKKPMQPVRVRRTTEDGTEKIIEVYESGAIPPGDSKEWRRVVAVFTGGKEYEFKQFPNGPKPVDVFSKYKGFHLRYEDEPLDPNVAKWNVVVVVVHKAASKRYLDRVCTLKIFEELDKVIK